MGAALVDHVRLMQLADSALPIGAAAHSFGLETLCSEGAVSVHQIEAFFSGYLEETGALEALFCRAAYRLGASGDDDTFEETWSALNHRLGALKPARESRSASVKLGRRFLLLVVGLEERLKLRRAVRLMHEAGIEPHYAPAFGLCCGVLGLGEGATSLAYLHQTVGGLLSACQRLLPLGQSQASQILWRLKPSLVEAAQRGAAGCYEDLIPCWTPMLDVAGMRHPALPTRLFMS